MEKERETEQNTLTHRWLWTGAIACAVLVMIGNCFASTITLQWDPETATDLAGYKVYYSTTSAGAFTGTGANEGASPVNISTQNTATITGLDPGQPHYFAVTAYNTDGVESPYSNIVEVGELIPPAVFFSYPASNATVAGVVSVNANASDNIAVTRLEIYLNGLLQSTYTEGPFSFSWDTSALAAGAYTLAAKAYDAAGNVGESTVSVTVANDSSAPIVVLAAPNHGATLRGMVPLVANAIDDVGVSKVEFYVNGSILTAGNVAPYSYNWDTTNVANGSYTISAKAYDATGKVGVSSNLVVTVQNDRTAPTASITAPATGTNAADMVTVAAAASDDTAVTQVEFFVNGALVSTSTAAPYSYRWDTRNIANGGYTISVKAHDAAGNVGEVASVAVNVFNDMMAPVVSITSPAADMTASGTTVVRASASDDTAVSKVEFFVNGTLEVTSTTAPYSFTWETTSLTNGSYSIGAKAYDAAGNIGISANVSANVYNDKTAPAVSIVSPLTNQTAGETVAVSVSARDDVAVQKVEIYLDGLFEASSFDPPYSFSLDTSALLNGSHTLTAKAYDGSRNVGESGSVVFNVFNDNAAPAVTGFSMPEVINSMTVPVSSFYATDNIGVTGYLITESAVAPSAFAADWSATAPTSFTFAGTGSRTAYAWAKDAAGHVSASASATLMIDMVLPVITSLVLQNDTVTVTVNAAAQDNVAVSKMQLYLDNMLQEETQSSSMSFAWAVPVKRSQTLTVKVYDVAGNLRVQSLKVSKN